MCEQGQALTGEGLGGLLVGAGRDAVSLPGPGGTEHGQDGADARPTPPMGDPWEALVVGALLWALASVVVASESARRGMRRRTWGWVASFLTASLVAAYAFGKVV